MPISDRMNQSESCLLGFLDTYISLYIVFIIKLIILGFSSFLFNSISVYLFNSFKYLYMI